MVGELGCVSNMVMNDKTISGNQLEVDLLGAKNVMMKMTDLEEDKQNFRRSTTKTSVNDSEDLDLARVALAVCHKMEDTASEEGTTPELVGKTPTEAMQKAANR